MKWLGLLRQVLQMSIVNALKSWNPPQKADQGGGGRLSHQF
jgi:hypothetical protein